METHSLSRSIEKSIHTQNYTNIRLKTVDFVLGFLTYTSIAMLHEDNPSEKLFFSS